jgi:hypothetical protein
VRIVAYHAFLWKRLRIHGGGAASNDGFGGGGGGRGGQGGHSSFLNGLPLELRAEVALFLHAPMVTRVPLFRGCSAGLLSDIVVSLRPQ